MLLDIPVWAQLHKRWRSRNLRSATYCQQQSTDRQLHVNKHALCVAETKSVYKVGHLTYVELATHVVSIILPLCGHPATE